MTQIAVQLKNICQKKNTCQNFLYNIVAFKIDKNYQGGLDKE